MMQPSTWARRLSGLMIARIRTPRRLRARRSGSVPGRWRFPRRRPRRTPFPFRRQVPRRHPAVSLYPAAPVESPRLPRARRAARLFEVGKAEVERIGAGCLGQFVHEALAGEVVGRCRQHAVRALAQWRTGRHVPAVSLARPVRRIERKRRRVDVDEVPGCQLAAAVEGWPRRRSPRPGGNRPR